MIPTLYQKLIGVENLQNQISDSIRELTVKINTFSYGLVNASHVEIPKISVEEVQKEIIRAHKQNPILADAVSRKISIHDTLEELAQVNKGIKKFLPRKKNDIQNKKVEYIGELIKEPIGLKSRGLIRLDNLFNGILYTVVAIYAANYAASTYASPNNIIKTAEDLEINQFINKALPAGISLIMAPTLGFVAGQDRFAELPYKQADYIDQKIKDLKI